MRKGTERLNERVSEGTHLPIGPAAADDSLDTRLTWQHTNTELIFSAQL